jgi:maleylacetoacetate isomerase/maleylpyruvate isomerase
VERALYGYWRSSAAYRVRIALGWKGLAYRHEFIDLRIGAQSTPEFKALNPQGFVPYFKDGAHELTQSLAIIEYLEETYPSPPLLPRSPIERAHVRAMSQVVACDVHPVNNLRVLRYLSGTLALVPAQVEKWARHWIESGFATLEARAHAVGPYLFGSQVTIADLCLVPQLYNARRVHTNLAPYPRLLAAEAHLQRLPAFMDARPEVQPEATA